MVEEKPSEEKSQPRQRRGQPQPQQRGRVIHEFKCTSCQGILANYGKGEVKCFGVQGKPYLARYEKIPTTNKKAPYIILGTSTQAETTGSKKFSTQWGTPGNSSIEQLSDLETQKALGTKIYKRLKQNGSFVYQQFLPKCSYLCNTMFSATVKLTKKISGGGGSSKEGNPE